MAEKRKEPQIALLPLIKLAKGSSPAPEKTPVAIVLVSDNACLVLLELTSSLH